jgi:hypothetical protein
VTLVYQPAAFAMRHHGSAVMAWIAAGFTFLASCFLPGDPVRVVGVALVASSAVAALGLALVVTRGVKTSVG